MRGRSGFFGFLVVVVLALLVGGVAYNWGLAAGQTQAVAPGTVVYAVGYGHPFGFGFGIFGFLFVVFFIGLLFRAFRPRGWSGGPGGRGHGMGPGGWGPGGLGGRFDPTDPRAQEWLKQDVPPPFQPMLEAWHRRAHAEAGDVPGAPGGRPTDGSASSPAGGTGGPIGA